MGEKLESRGIVPPGYPHGTLGLSMVLKAMEENPRVIEITRTGVVQLPDSYQAFSVNGECILEHIRSEVEKRHPVKDHDGKFAGKITVRLEFLGDMEVE